MNVVGLILSGILLLILLLLFCPLVVKVVYDGQISLKVGLLFPVIRVLPAKPKKPKPEKKKKTKKQKKKPEQDQGKKKNRLFEKVKSKGLSGIIELLKELVDILKKMLKKITDHLVIATMDLEIALATEDAAQTALSFGNTCAAVFPLIALIEQSVKKCNHRENIYPVFTDTETKVYFVLKARILPFFLLSAAMGALFRMLKTLAKL